MWGKKEKNTYKNEKKWSIFSEQKHKHLNRGLETRGTYKKQCRKRDAQKMENVGLDNMYEKHNGS